MHEQTERLLLERHAEGAVLLLRLNIPEKLNALATPFLREIADVLVDAEGDEAIRVVVITGSEKVFAAGADINELYNSDGTEPIDSPRFNAWRDIRRFAKPLIAAIEGWCLGAGTELLMCADIAIAGDKARIGLPETNLGIIPGAGGTAILPRLVGRALALQMVLTGEPISPVDAKSAGLLAQVVTAGQALPTALDLASRLSQRAPLALVAAKASIRDAQELPLEQHMRAERQRFIDLLATADKKEGIDAFREKREAVWRNR
ncbi:enoyl-CoA hydratase-related protein [Aurantiacibacter sediminis]|uniref:Enoyl-CoA hydratase/isomerase family protein n=1 Tax=Aurantiacibacter sediminis TaxID=2793064 RepID=A0ABS0N6K0_9SPHN|nr:enoyl-CoA hydratase-related protein [Aurantiacibacter sediminis]MBH5323449.1 enoyl-CoA hydratase/isomerase family protein [Aurantiacibacter sediminis]